MHQQHQKARSTSITSISRTDIKQPVHIMSISCRLPCAVKANNTGVSNQTARIMSISRHLPYDSKASSTVAEVSNQTVRTLSISCHFV